jgi:hypothetical protein
MTMKKLFSLFIILFSVSTFAQNHLFLEGSQENQVSTVTEESVSAPTALAEDTDPTKDVLVDSPSLEEANLAESQEGVVVKDSILADLEPISGKAKSRNLVVYAVALLVIIWLVIGLSYLFPQNKQQDS